MLFFALVSTTVITIDHSHEHLKLVRSTLSTIIYPVQAAVNMPIKLGRWASRSFASKKVLLEENVSLSKELELLEIKLQGLEILEVLEEENSYLRKLLGVTNELKERVLIAELVAVELEPSRHMAEINKGTNDGIYEGQPVLDLSGIVGQIYHADPFSSKVLLITDPNCTIPIQINRSGLRAIALGTGQRNILTLKHLPTNADIEEGDLVISSGLGRLFPKGYPVGTIHSISVEAGSAFSAVTIKPSAKLTQDREVLLVWLAGVVRSPLNQK